MIKMVDFMLCVFYQNLKKKKKGILAGAGGGVGKRGHHADKHRASRGELPLDFITEIFIFLLPIGQEPLGHLAPRGGTSPSYQTLSRFECPHQGGPIHFREGPPRKISFS